MTRRTLIDFFADLSVAIDGEFLVYDDGYRSWTYELRAIIGAAAARVCGHGCARAASRRARRSRSGARTAPEWIAALWGALLEGVVLVPIDYRASADFLLQGRGDRRRAAPSSSATPSTPRRSAARAPVLAARARLRPSERPPHASERRRPSRQSDDARRDGGRPPRKSSSPPARRRSPRASSSPIATSSRTSCRSSARWRSTRRYTRPFQPIRFLNLLPLSHMFGQAMATFVPPMLPGVVVFTRSYAPDDIVRQIRERRISVLVCVPKILEVLKEHVLRVAPGSGRAAAGRHALGEALVAATAASTGCSASSSGRWSSARRRSIRSSRRSGGGSDSSSCRATGSPKPRRSSR